MKTRLPFPFLLLLIVAAPAWAQDKPAAALPAWEQLTAEQRELLIAPVRERWNSDPAARARMLEHAQGWKKMTPEQRSRARQGMKRFENMSPEQREQARAVFSHTESMTPEQRKQFRTQWESMTPEQRRTWTQQHPPKPEAQRHGH